MEFGVVWSICIQDLDLLVRYFLVLSSFVSLRADFTCWVLKRADLVLHSLSWELRFGPFFKRS